MIEARYQLGLTLRKIGDIAGALKQLQAATELAPSLIEAQRALGNLAIEAGEYSAARAALEAVLAWEADDKHAREARERAIREGNQRD